MSREPMQDVIVLLPGILGSVLKKDNRDVWSLSGGALLRGLLTLGDSVRELELSADDPVAEHLDGVVADRVMRDVHLLPGFWKIDGYSKIAEAIAAVFDVKTGKNYHEFAYDWRRDNRASANRLERWTERWLADWKRESGAADPKLILIGHSMGGLVARYFLENLEGWQRTKALFTIGTPFRGSLNALDTLVHGIRKGPFGLLDLSRMTRSFTSVYQLLPIVGCLELEGVAELVRVGETDGIPNVDPAKAAAALRFHREIEEAVNKNQDNDEYRRQRYETFLLIGTEQPTNQSARLRGGELELLRAYKGTDNRGDGTVPRVSATPIEMSEARVEAFYGTRHASLQNADAALIHVEQKIRDLALNLGQFRAPEPPRVPVGLDIEDAYWPDEPIVVKALPSRVDVALEATITDLDDRAVASASLRSDGSGTWAHEFPPLPGGTYRVSVTGGSDAVRDVFVVYYERLAHE
jgi:pimeloyl-ACP methyl ester carboxylesterase